MKTKVILLMVFFLGWVTTGWVASHMKGDGKLISKKISVADYNEIKVDGVIDFSYEQSDDPSTVEVIVDQSLHPYVNTEVKDRVLTVAFKRAEVDHLTKLIVKTNPKWFVIARVSENASFMVNSPLTGDETAIKANVNSSVQLKEIATVGKPDLSVSDNINTVVSHPEADKIECDIDGSGSITIKKGNAKEGDYGIVSSGDIHVFGLAVSQLSYKVTGNGLVGVYATDNLKANVVDKGNIRYKGPIAVQQRIIGKGIVEETKE